jgi:hypothetical protein
MARLEAMLRSRPDVVAVKAVARLLGECAIAGCVDGVRAQRSIEAVLSTCLHHHASLCGVLSTTRWRIYFVRVKACSSTDDVLSKAIAVCEHDHTPKRQASATSLTMACTDAVCVSVTVDRVSCWQPLFLLQMRAVRTRRTVCQSWRLRACTDVCTGARAPQAHCRDRVFNFELAVNMIDCAKSTVADSASRIVVAATRGQPAAAGDDAVVRALPDTRHEPPTTSLRSRIYNSNAVCVVLHSLCHVTTLQGNVSIADNRRHCCDATVAATSDDSERVRL